MSNFKIDREQIQMVIALVAVAVVAVFFLGLTDIVTREPIATAQKSALHKALVQVLPEHQNDPLADVIHLKPSADESSDNGGLADKTSKTKKPFYPAKDKQGNIIGLAWETIAPDGYKGTIRILMGVLPDGSVHAIRITDHRETPGLGDHIVLNTGWINSFIGKTLKNTRWAVKKDHGDFDQFTGATITPRAVVKAVKKGLELFKANKKELLLTPPSNTSPISVPKAQTDKGEKS